MGAFLVSTIVGLLMLSAGCDLFLTLIVGKLIFWGMVSTS
jgi:hypothetical protein